MNSVREYNETHFWLTELEGNIIANRKKSPDIRPCLCTC